jgi:23S rRNA (guanosine2251-2'-O)-methyltransferase
MAQLKERGYLLVGLDADADADLGSLPLPAPLALVLGAEGKGLRQLTRDHCDRLCRISTENAFASLNVSNAAAVSLHWASLKTKG